MTSTSVTPTHIDLLTHTDALTNGFRLPRQQHHVRVVSLWSKRQMPPVNVKQANPTNPGSKIGVGRATSVQFTPRPSKLEGGHFLWSGGPLLPFPRKVSLCHKKLHTEQSTESRPRVALCTTELVSQCLRVGLEAPDTSPHLSTDNFSAGMS